MLMTMLMMTATVPMMMMMMAYLNAIAFYFRLHDLFENIDPNTTVTELIERQIYADRIVDFVYTNSTIYLHS